MTHTPGPWEAYAASHHIEGNIRLENSSGLFDPTLEDLWLIDAAPDLLAALENLVLQCENPEIGLWGKWPSTTKANAAIRKAKGE